jgi:hypothetical protein
MATSTSFPLPEGSIVTYGVDAYAYKEETTKRKRPKIFFLYEDVYDSEFM